MSEKKPGWCLNGPDNVRIEDGSTYVCWWAPEVGPGKEQCAECVYFSTAEDPRCPTPTKTIKDLKRKKSLLRK